MKEVIILILACGFSAMLGVMVGVYLDDEIGGDDDGN